MPRAGDQSAPAGLMNGSRSPGLPHECCLMRGQLPPIPRPLRNAEDLQRSATRPFENPPRLAAQGKRGLAA